jgi:SecD/SecF fusion protein
MFVPIFMIIYYHLAGVIAVVALLLNMAMLLASMALTGSSITLPGLAGFALTIGMAVDANVLIFERMREERDKGATVAQQIRNGFDRAWTTILDSNVTTMLIGLVLWAGGTEEVKGFALVLILGLLWNLFTAVYVSRTLFDLAYTQGWLKRITMSRWISDLLNNSKFDFVGPRRLCMLASAVALAVCLGFFFNRGGANEKGDMYNIDFTGGTLVTVRVDDPAAKAGSGSAQVEEVRKLASEALPNVFVESLKIEGAPFARYNIRTTESDPVKVQDAVVESFGDKLVRVELTGSEATPIAEDNDEAAFPGGTSYALRFNLPQTPTKIADELAEILSASEPPIASPQTRIKVTNPDAGPNEPDAGAEDLTFATNLDPAVAKAAVEQLATRLSADKDFLFERLENFGSVVAGETRAKAIIAIVLSWAMMVGYLWFRFKSVSYGIAAVIALVHDVIIALGAVAIAGYKIDLPMVAAFLTLIGFSVNDTIVIFDRIREIKGKSPTLTPAVVNDAINVTLSRTVLTTFTTWSVVMIFYLFGGESLRGFSFCLVVGFLSGTYSTIFIAAPILIEWMGQGDKKTTIEELATNAR